MCAILFGALEGLHAAHEARDPRGDPLELVHRDVSPHNILIGTDGIARVLDFGVAKARGRAQTTRVGQLKGKLAYMAPEQLRGKVTRRSDVFSASVVLWEALTGARLFQGDDEGDVVNRLLAEEIPSPRQYAPGVARELEAIVMRGLERDPAARFPTARHMALAIEDLAIMATPIEVGAWVERVAGVTLAQRAERVASIEAEFARVIDAGPTEGTGAVVVAALPPHRPAALSVTGATAPTVAVPGLALSGDKTTVDEGMEPTRTGVASVSDMNVRALTRRRSRVATLAWLVAGGAALGLVLTIRAVSQGRSPEVSAGASLSSVASAMAVEPSPAAASSQVIEGPAPSESPEARPSLQNELPIRRAPLPAVRKRTGCSPPYTVDARGVRHYKPECL